MTGNDALRKCYESKYLNGKVYKFCVKINETRVYKVFKRKINNSLLDSFEFCKWFVEIKIIKRTKI